MFRNVTIIKKQGVLGFQSQFHSSKQQCGVFSVDSISREVCDSVHCF